MTMEWQLETPKQMCEALRLHFKNNLSGKKNKNHTIQKKNIELEF